VNDDDEPTEGEKIAAQFVGFLAGLSLFVWVLYFLGWI
jgi:hypothetical protein